MRRSNYDRKTEFKVLVLRRIESRGGYYQPVCGGGEEGETLIDTVKSEVYEETGIQDIMNIHDLDYTFTYKETKNGKLMKIKDVCFACEIGEIKSIELSDEHDKYYWCSINHANILFEWIHNKNAFNKLLSKLN